MDVRAEAVEMDRALSDSPQRLLDAAYRIGSLFILVNNAAHSTRDGFEELNAASLDVHDAVNVWATALLCVEFARRYTGGPGGRIVNLTSGSRRGRW